MIVKNSQIDCTHCGLPVPKGRVDRQKDEQFCCSGCQSAWQLIHSSGLDEFYRMIDATIEADRKPQVGENGGRFANFDQSEFQEKFVTIDGELAAVTLALSGIHCAACVWLIEKLPVMLPGTIEAKVNWSKATVTIRWQAEQIKLSQIAQTLCKLGYLPRPVGKNESIRARQSENRKQLIQIGIAAAAAGNNMLIAAALYLGMFSYMSGGIETLLRVASCFVGLVSFLGPGRLFLRGAINAIRTRTPHMDLPIALALTVGSIAGVVNTIRGAGEIYFDSLSVLICLLLIGRWVQFRQQNRAADAVELLYRLTPQRAIKVVDGNCVEVSLDELQKNDTIQVRPGDLIAADGVVVAGYSEVDESILTGESRLVPRTTSDEVSAGTKNVGGVLAVRVTAVGSQTRIHKVMQLVEGAASSKPQIVQWADRIGGYFVAVVVLLSVATLIMWLSIHPDRAVDRVVALLVVACPCALAMATPLAISVALGKLARDKILVKSGDVLQYMNEPGIVWLDKTGTLTQGKIRVTSWAGDRSWIPVVAIIERNFNHPIASAMGDYFESSEFSGQCLTKPSFKWESQQFSGGVSAIVEGQRIIIGNRALLEQEGVVITGNWEDEESRILLRHQSPCWIAVDGRVVAVASLGDTIREDGRQIVRELMEHGWEVGILSGDHRQVVATVANELGIQTFHSEVTPEQKLEVIEKQRKEKETVVMVGDGVNDSAALAAATVGISVQGGAEASLAAAPVYLAKSGLLGIRDLIATAKATSRTIRLNFGASLTYNVIGVGLAISGFLNPLVAAILMPLSSITVITLSLTAARSR